MAGVGLRNGRLDRYLIGVGRVVLDRDVAPQADNRGHVYEYLSLEGCYDGFSVRSATDIAGTMHIYRHTNRKSQITAVGAAS